MSSRPIFTPIVVNALMMGKSNLPMLLVSFLIPFSLSLALIDLTK